MRRNGPLLVAVAMVGSAACGGEVTLHLLSGLAPDAGDAFDGATADASLDVSDGAGAPPVGVAVEIVSSYSGTCIDVGSSKQAGSALSLTVCQGLAEQLLVLRENGENGKRYSLFNPNSGLCVAVEEKDAAVGNGMGLELAKCSDASTQLFDAEGTTGGAYVFTSEAGGPVCLDDEAFGAGNGAPVIVYACNAGTNQKWSLVP